MNNQDGVTYVKRKKNFTTDFSTGAAKGKFKDYFDKLNEFSNSFQCKITIQVLKIFFQIQVILSVKKFKYFSSLSGP